MDSAASIKSSIKSLGQVSQISQADGGLRFTIFSYDLKRTLSTLDHEDHFSALPEEIILHIFKFFTVPELRTCALVSKFWLTVSCSAELWCNVTLNSMCIEIPFLERILNCNVQDIHLSEMKINLPESPVRPLLKTPKFDSLQRISLFYTKTDHILTEEILSLSPNMRIIELLGCTCDCIGSNFFREVVKLSFFEKLYLCFVRIEEVPDIVKIFKNAQKFMYLTYISFIVRSPSTNSPESMVLSEEFFESFLALCPNLEYLTLRRQYINDESFRYILQMEHLKELNIRRNTMRVNVDLLYTENFNKWDNLHKLYIDNIDMPPGMRTTLLHLSPNLEVLDISGLITGSIFELILNMDHLKELRFSGAELSILHSFGNIKKFKELRILHLSKGQYVTAPLMYKLLWRCHNLSELMIFGHEIDENIFKEILKMPNLEKLEFLDIKTIVPFDIKTSSGNYQKFEKLKFLDLIFDNPKPDPVTVESILISCENLIHLEIGYCDINDAVWRHILSMISLESLRISDLEGENFDSSNNMDNLEKFPKLAKLEVYYADLQRNPHRLEALLPLCSNVRNLYLNNTTLTDSICRSIASMTELRSLYLSFLLNVTDEKIDKILEGCPKLTKKRIRILQFRSSVVSRNSNTSGT